MKVMSLIFVCLIFCYSNFTYAQTRNLDRELLVYIMHDSLDFPSDRGNQLTLDNVVIRSKNLKRELQKLNVKMISKAFPNILTP